MSLTFKKVEENFVCEHCGERVTGNGFTNHCPRCLWSKHVDVFPGDRASKCLGKMKPIKLEQEKGCFVVTHECTQCGYMKRNKLSPEDNFDNLIQALKTL